MGQVVSAQKRKLARRHDLNKLFSPEYDDPNVKLDDFEQGDVIGHGAFGEVRVAAGARGGVVRCWC